MNDWIMAEQLKEGEGKPHVSKWGAKACNYDRVNIRDKVIVHNHFRYHVTAYDWYQGNFIYLHIGTTKWGESIEYDPWRDWTDDDRFITKSVLIAADEKGLTAIKDYLTTLVEAIMNMDTIFTRNRMTVITVDKLFSFQKKDR